MASNRLINREIAIEEGRSFHGDKYDYSLLEYIDYATPLKIICPEHGLFEQKYQKHCRLGRGCWKCGKKSCVEKRQTRTQGDIIESAIEVHNNFYNYSDSIYNGYNEEMVINCPVHGKFSQLVSSHLMGYGCSDCGIIKAGKSRRKGKTYILEKFNTRHKEFYNYNLHEDIKTDDIIEIECPIHGLFKQIVHKHYIHGCSKCGDIKISESQRKIPKELSRVVKNIKRRVKGFIKNEGYRKSSTTNEIVGISWLELKNYLEDNPYNFKVDCLDLDIDHIIPLCTVKCEADIYKLNHYMNLQLLPKIYNQFVKKDKPFEILDFEKWLIETNYKEC